MIFQFLITYRRTEQTEIENVLVELLSKVLEDNFNEVESSVIQEMIRVQYERTGGVSSDETGMASSYAILSFIVDLADETSQIETVVDEFATQLMETPPIFHAVKFEDPILHFELLQRAEEIFALEMKLRRVLTFIYLFANQGNDDPYDLLSDEAVQPMSKERPQMAQMKAAAENQFFHLTFGQYVNLNHRLEFKQVSALLEVVRDSSTYDVFRAELSRPPVQHEDDSVLLAGLKERMDAIEAMRNCVAHNRRPNRKTTENYINARPLLDQMLDNYLTRWERLTPAVIAAPTETNAAPHEAEPPEATAGLDIARPESASDNPATPAVDEPPNDAS